MNLPIEAGCSAARAPDAALANPCATAIPDPAGLETEIVVVTRHGITIGSGTKACKRQSTRVAAWRRKGVSCVASEGLPTSDDTWSIENKEKSASRAARTSQRAGTGPSKNNVQTSL